MDEAINVTFELTRDNLNLAPTTAGVYVFKQGDEILYIGKSVNIKARLISHWESAKTDNKEAAIVTNSNTIDCIITDSEFNALLLESSLIQKYHPKYNARWRDDKTYLYIKITTKDGFPKVYATRREMEDNASYFGPFSSNRQVLAILRAIRRVVPFCTQHKIGKQACFYSKIGQCNPCPNVISHVTDDLKKKQLTLEYRANIKTVIKILNGKIDAVQKDLMSQIKAFTERENYEEAIVARNKLLLLEQLGRQPFSSPVEIQIINRSAESEKSLRQLLSKYFPELPDLERIECYDISNTNQQEITASMVVMSEGLIDKKEYRKFKIKDVTVQSDFEAMNEVLRRRFKNDWKHPDLLVLDGGKPQVRVGLQVLSDLGLSIPLIGIAKRPDRFVIGIPDTPMVRPSQNHLGFNLIRALRDESHRFAKKYHVHLRNAKFLSQ